MFQNEFQTDFISILYALPRTKPLQIWDAKVKQKKRQSEEEEEKKGEWGSVQMVHDDDLQAAVVEVRGDGRTTSITCPAPSSRTAHLHLAITLPVFVLVVKHLRFFYSYQVEVLDDSGVKRVFRFTNTQNTIRSYGMTTTIIPLQLAEGWNMIQVDLAELVRSQYGTKYIETIRVTINANCRIRQIYFSDQLYEEEELKDEHKFFLPIQDWLCRMVSQHGRSTILELHKGKGSIINAPKYGMCRKLEGVRVDGYAPIRRRRPKVCEGCPS